eukprot:snap_masked-scaffold_8-processed-gene-7.28-mRNA-1 protein AED:1.00 eAED:1.00 QI:0/-1/0/0/-1/1/1/0/363
METKTSETSYCPKLQQACSSCRKKKRKCDSKKPICTRCISLGQSCFYEPAKKRGRKSRQMENVVKNKFTRTETDMIKSLFLSVNTPEPILSSCSLQIFGKEHLAWKLLDFFSQEVSKNFEALSLVPCSDISSLFYAGMIYELGNHLEYRAKHDGTFSHAVDRFTEIVTEKGLTYSGVLKTLERQFNLHDQLEQTEKLAPNLSYLSKSYFFTDATGKYPSFKEVSVGIDNEKKVSLNKEYEVNSQFEAMFGYSSEHLSFIFEQSVTGVLPAGSNVISLLGSEGALMKYVSMYAVVAQHSCKPNEMLTMPGEIELCNSLVVDLHTRSGWRKFQVFTLTYESGSFSEYVCENRMHFIPLERTIEKF